MSTAARRSVRLNTSWPAGPRRATVARRSSLYDAADGGHYRIAGTVAIDDNPDIPVSRRTRLYHQQSGRLVREMWSAAGTGAYEFRDLRLQQYFVVAHDHTNYYNAAIKDTITPELQP